MKKKNPHIGSTFESWLDEEGLREDVTAAAMKTKRITKSVMAGKMKASRAQLDRLLDPNNTGVTLETLQRAAKIVGRTLRLELA